MSTSAIVLELGTVVNFGPIASGFSSIAEIARSSTNAMAEGFTELAATTSTADEQMIASIATLGVAIESVTTAISAMPARVVPAVQESASAFTVLQERMTEAAVTAKISAEGIGSAFGGLGALLGGGLVVGMIGHLLDQTNKEVIALGNLADKSGISISALAGLQLITRELGVDFGTIEQGLVRLDRAQALAVEGGKAQTAAFARIGISIEELRSLTPEELLNRVSEGIQQSGSSADRAASAFALLGRGGSALIPIFKQYGDTLDDVITKTGEESGVTDQARQESLKWQKASADLGDELREIAIKVIPLITDGFINFNAFLEDMFLEAIIGFENLGSYAIGTAKAVGDAAVLNFGQAAKDMDEATAEVGLRNTVTALQVTEIWEKAAARIKGVELAPKVKEPDVPTGEGKDPTAKRGEQAAAYKDLLASELAALSAETAGQKVLYEQQEISGQQWIATVERNTDQAYAYESSYFAKLRALYADDPTKLAAINAEQTKTGFATLAHEEEQLAESTKKLNTETREFVAQSQKAETKQQEADIKAITKAILERAEAVKELITSQKALETAEEGDSGAAAIERVKEQAASRKITKLQEAEEIEGIYRQEEAVAIASIQKEIDAGQLVVDAAKVRMEEMGALYGPGSKQSIEAQAAYDRDLAGFNELQTKKLTLQEEYGKKIAEAQQQADAAMQVNQKRYFSVFNADLNTLLGDWIIGHQRMGIVVENMLAKGLVDLAQYTAQWLAKKAEMYILERVFHTAATSEQIALDASAAAEDAATTAAANVATATSNVGVAATGAAASQAMIPFAGPELALTAAAAMVGGLSPFVAMAAFEKGGIVPEDMTGRLHGGEMVLPRELSVGVQNMVQQGSDGPAGRDGASAGGTHIGALNFHYHAGSGGSDINKDGEQMFSFMKGKLRRMGINLG